MHVGVLDAVVHHLHEMAGPIRTHVGDTGARVRLGGDGLQHRADVLVGLALAARHHAGAVARAVFTSGHAHAEEVDVLGGHALLAALGVLVPGVAPVDHDVSRLEQWLELIEH